MRFYRLLQQDNPVFAGADQNRAVTIRRNQNRGNIPVFVSQLGDGGQAIFACAKVQIRKNDIGHNVNIVDDVLCLFTACRF